jgi:DNA polymerase elongation subunit (family B)
LKILLLDIETAPNLATVWGLFKQNIGINQMIESSYTLCWAAKWLGEDWIYFDSVHRSNPKQMIKRIHAMLDEADAVIHYNGTRFDMPTLNKEFLLHGLPPPIPYKQIDLLRTARNQFRFPSNKLDYVAQQLGLGSKTSHLGHEMWLKCMNGDDEAWNIMEEYNCNDVQLLEDLYNTLLPWIKGHPNRSVFQGEKVCPTCGGNHFQKRGFAFTTAGKYQRFQCLACRTWFRDVANVADKSKFTSLGV